MENTAKKAAANLTETLRAKVETLEALAVAEPWRKLLGHAKLGRMLLNRAVASDFAIGMFLLNKAVLEAV